MAKVKKEHLERYALVMAYHFCKKYHHRRFNRGFRLTLDKQHTGGPFAISLRATGKNIRYIINYGH